MSKQVILCVDDEKSVLDILKEQLRATVDKDFIIEVADNGQDAIAIIEEYALKNYPILMVISDYIMPGMCGDELLRTIHNNHPEIVNILLTGQATFDGISAIINNASLFRFIQKPWQKEDLLLSVQEGIKSYLKDRVIIRQNEVLKSQNAALETWSKATVEALGKALDSRDTTTSGHSKRMADLAVSLAKKIDQSTEPAFVSVSYSEQEIEVLYYAALLHDIGKIGVGEHILLKKHRLSDHQIKAIKTRYRLLEYQLSNRPQDALSEADVWFLSNSEVLFERISQMSLAESLAQEDLDYLNFIVELQILDDKGNTVHLLESDEQTNLEVRYGNLTHAEREIIKTHASITYEILSDIPWPEHLANVPMLAASHHERLDGTGYYKGLCGDQLTMSTRILAVLDVYEALTSQDRPYRQRQTPTSALNILQQEAAGGRLDGAIINMLMSMIESNNGDIHA